MRRPPGPGVGADATADDNSLFERQRPRLFGLAYRMLGTIADAEDVVQDAWLRWRAVQPDTVERPEAWLTTVTTRLALDRIRAQQRRRLDYVGPWLPEPLVSDAATEGTDPEQAAQLADSLTLGFLTVLDQLGPIERAVFVLADIFAFPYSEIAAVVGKSDAACRQIASRARRRVRATGEHRAAGKDRQLVDSLITALALGDIDGILARLAPDAICVSDGGATRRAARRTIVGADRVVRFLVNLTKRYAGEASVEPATVNGDPGVVISIGGTVDLVVAFEVDGDRVVAIRLIRNPDKLAHIWAPPALV